MLSWIVDHAILLNVLLIITGLVMLAGWWGTKKKPFLYGLAGVGCLALVIFLLSLFVETDRKRITRNIEAMSVGITNRPPDQLFRYISKNFKSAFVLGGAQVTLNYDQLKAMAASAGSQYKIEDMIIKELHFVSVTNNEAQVTFSAKPVVKGESYLLPCPCEAKFVKEEDGEWRMIKFKVFKPFIDTNEMLDLPISK